MKHYKIVLFRITLYILHIKPELLFVTKDFNI